MNTTIMSLLIGVIGILVIILLVAIRYLFGKRPSSNITAFSSIQQLRSIGQLSVFKAITQTIITKTDHLWGDVGEKYFSWIITNKKMAMIFKFAIDFRYDLRRPEFAIIGAVNKANNAYIIKMPPCIFETYIKDFKFYDEQGARFMPWLLPELVNGFFVSGFSEADKNKLIEAAKSTVEQEAMQLIESLQSEVQNSAKSTLQSIARAFGAENVAFEFLPQGEIKLEIGVSKKVAG